MNNKAKTSKVAVAGVVSLTAAGIAATIVLANDPAADTPDTKDAQRPESASAAQQYTGPRTADAAEAWLESGPAYTGPRTADAAEAWLESDPTTSTPVEPVTEHSVSTLQCLVTADTAEHWIRATGHPPCEP